MTYVSASYVSAGNDMIVASRGDGSDRVISRSRDPIEWAAIMASDLSIGAYVAPAAPTQAEIDAAARAGMQLSFAQLLIGLVAEGWITEAEGEAWLAGTLPAGVLALIATLPQAAQFPARARAVAPSYVVRLDPLVVALAQAQGKSDTQLDTFFLTYAQV